MKRILPIAAALLGAALIFYSCAEPVIPQGYALVYGITDYAPLNNLSLTDDDAEAVAELLDAKGWEVTLGLNEDADMESLISDINSLKSVMGEDDRFLFYYSGHGHYLDLSGSSEPSSAADDYDEILVLHGAATTLVDYMNGNTNADVLSVTVSDDSLAEMLSELPSSNKTVIIDACFSGGFIGDGFTLNTIDQNYTAGSVSTIFSPVETVKMYMNYSPTTYDLPQDTFTIMTASGESEESWESSDIGHGIFTYFLLNSPEYADYNLDGYISVIEAYRFAADGINTSWNTGSSTTDYMANIGAFPVDPVLFKAD